MAKTTILVVEDEGIVAKDIQSRLRRLGYDVPATAATGDEAVALAGTIRPDIILMDIMIQGDMDGIETAGKITEQWHIPIIYVTAYSDENTLKRARTTGPFGYLLKPFAERELYTTIEMALYKHGVDQKLQENERWLATILKSICDAVIATDLSGNVTFMNSVAETLTGWKLEESRGKNINEIFTVINEETRARIETPIDAVLRVNSSVDLSNHAILITKTKQEVYIDNNAAPIRDENGAVSNIVLTFRDVTTRKLAEKQLQKSETQYQTLISSLPVVVYSISGNGNVEYLNPSFEIMSGWPARTWLNKPFSDIIHPDDQALAIEMFHRVMKGETPPPYYLRVLTHSGEYRIGEFSSQPQFENGAIVGKFGVVRDVTEEKKAQEALKQSEMHLQKTQLRLSTLLRNLPNVVLYETGGGREFISENIYGMVGYTADELTRDRTSFLKLIHPDDLKSMLEKMERWHLDGEPGVLSYQFRVRHKDGRYIWLEDYLVGIKTEEQPEYISGVMIDISDRKAADEKMRLQRAYFEHLFANLPEAVVVINHDDLSIANANHGFTELFQYSNEETIGKSIDDLIVPNDQKEQAAELTKQAKGGITIEIEAKRRRKDGSVIDVSVLSAPIEVDGTIIAGFGIYRDITERKKAQAELLRAKEAAEESDRLKTSFISMVSHEVRTPLNTILGFTRIVRMALSETIGEDKMGPFEEFFATIERSGDRLMKLIESFLDIASIQAGNMRLRLSDAPIEQLASHAANEMRLKIEEAGLQFIEKYQAPNAYVHIDAERFAQIVTNILSNAVKFTPKGSIAIETSVIGNAVQITIADTGIGISKAFLPNIYTPFRQGSEGFTRGFQGAGLGLSIAQGLTEAMGGTIELMSAEGKGTSVVITFPLIERRPESAAEEPLKTAPPRSHYMQSGKGRRALVAEDNLENITYIRAVLHRGGWEVRTASTAEDTLRMLNEEMPDVVLMDINLLGTMNGFDALKIIQGDKRFTHLPVIAVTAYAFETERQLIMDAGFDDYLTKPFSPDQLYDVLAKHVPLIKHG